MHATPLLPRRALAAAAAALALVATLLLAPTLDRADFSIGADRGAPAAVPAPAQNVTPTPDFSQNPFSRPFLQPPAGAR